MTTKTHFKKIRQLLSLLLCCLLLAGCLGLTASADEGEAAQPRAEDEFIIEREPEPDEFPPTVIVPGADDGLEEPPAEGSIEVTFDFGGLGRAVKYVAPGEAPDAIPPVPEENAWQGYVAEAWLDSEGNEVDPAGLAVTGPVTYTARTARSVSALLDTDEHKAYINGVSGEIFSPQGSLTRAEAATLFSNLLRIKDFDHSAKFKDVKSGDWFCDAVGRVNALGIATGSADTGFRPKAKITRAEFVRMAASCDTLEDGGCPFTDVPDNNWARKYIVSAYTKGWINPSGNGKFRPGDIITRAEAVTILNNMLDRTADPDIESMDGVSRFSDVFPTHWAYEDIIEASVGHEFHTTEEGSELVEERWDSHEQYKLTGKRGWLTVNGVKYYIGKDGMCVRGEQTIDGTKYTFDNNGGGATGFFKVGSWTRYYKNGVIVDDISNLGVVKGPYYIKVYKPANYLIVFAKDSSGKYTIPVRSMLTSCGYPTPTGDYYTPGKYRWLEMVGGSWAQWCTQIIGSYLFHSVPNDLKNNYTMWSGEYNNLGTTRSLGCIRLNCEDAKWIYDNCDYGTHVYISPTETSGPLKKPAGLKIPSWHTWDPTDPTAKYLCKEHGCH